MSFLPLTPRVPVASVLHNKHMRHLVGHFGAILAKSQFSVEVSIKMLMSVRFQDYLAFLLQRTLIWPSFIPSFCLSILVLPFAPTSTLNLLTYLSRWCPSPLPNYQTLHPSSDSDSIAFEVCWVSTEVLCLEDSCLAGSFLVDRSLRDPCQENPSLGIIYCDVLQEKIGR